MREELANHPQAIRLVLSWKFPLYTEEVETAYFERNNPVAGRGVDFENALSHFGIVFRTDLIGRVFDEGGLEAQLLALRQHYEGLHAGYRKGLTELHVTAYYLADLLRDNTEGWAKFTSYPEWGGFEGEKPSIEDRPHSLRFVLRYMIGFGGKSRNERVSNAVTALEPLFDAFTPPKEIRRLIKEGGGIQKLAALNRRLKEIAEEEKRERSTALLFLHDKRGEAIFLAPVGTEVFVQLKVVEPRDGAKTFKILVINDGQEIPLGDD